MIIIILEFFVPNTYKHFSEIVLFLFSLNKNDFFFEIFWKFICNILNVSDWNSNKSLATVCHVQVEQNNSHQHAMWGPYLLLKMC